MPQVFHKFLVPNGEIGIWETIENNSYFLDRIQFIGEELNQFKALNEKRKKEWLASRFLLHTMSRREFRGEVVKDDFGKPKLTDTDYHISLSHSDDMVAVIAAPEVVGIDIQKKVAKISSIKHKFISNKEMEFVDMDNMEFLHIIWGAKESLFKCYGRRKLDFKQHIRIEPFKLEGKIGQFKGRVVKGDIVQVYDLSYYVFEDYILVYAIN